MGISSSKSPQRPKTAELPAFKNLGKMDMEHKFYKRSQPASVKIFCPIDQLCKCLQVWL